jgi:hypothetical protein
LSHSYLIDLFPLSLHPSVPRRPFKPLEPKHV